MIARVNGSPKDLLLVGGFAVAYGVVIVTFWRGFARFARRWSMGTVQQRDKIWGTLKEPKRLFVSVIGCGFVAWGTAVLIAGVANL